MRRVLITGANKGIGKALVEAVLKESDDTFVILGSRDVQRGKDAAASVGATDRLRVQQLDVTDDASVRRAAAALTETFGDNRPLYGLVNNAGIGLGSESLERVLDVNTLGVRRVCEAFLPLLQRPGGRLVNITSASGPNFVSNCSEEMQRYFMDTEVTWESLESLIQKCLTMNDDSSAFAARGLGGANSYGLSKALANSYTLLLAREHSDLHVNACTPGFIATDLTRPYAESQGKAPEDMGMKSPAEGTRSAIHLLFGELEGNGYYYGSDAQRSPLHRYRSPGDPPYTGE